MPGRSFSPGFRSSIRAWSVRLANVQRGVDERDPAREALAGPGRELELRLLADLHPADLALVDVREHPHRREVRDLEELGAGLDVDAAHRVLARDVAAGRRAEADRPLRLAGLLDGPDVLGGDPEQLEPLPGVPLEIARGAGG
jgi:hypothetical protein